jgi:hypothetical protein
MNGPPLDPWLLENLACPRHRGPLRCEGEDLVCQHGDVFPIVDVRYWTPRELLAAFEEAIGASDLSVDGFFGLGIQPADVDMLPLHFQAVVRSSELMRRLTNRVPSLRNAADSLYVTSRRRATAAPAG